MAGYTIEQVRNIAKKHAYKEISLNEVSRVISFRKESVRINVYYTTGTVGTCMNHPIKGKTQLFRRNVTLNELDKLFANPRSHTGKGYYRKHVGQAWKNAEGNLLSDMARRWEYVAEIMDPKAHAQTIERVKNLMDELSSILFEKHATPAFNRVRRGAREQIIEMALKFAIRDGALGMTCILDLAHYQSDRVTPDVKDWDDFRLAEENRALLQENNHSLDRSSKLLQMLPKMLRKEICGWLIGMLDPGFVLVKKNYERFDDNNVVVSAHVDYSKSFYTKRQLRYLDVTAGIILKSRE